MSLLPHIAVHQINTVTGDIEGNTNKILDLLRSDAEKGVEISVFPETAITGYMCGSLWDNEAFLRDQLKAATEIFDYSTSHEGVIIFGYVRYSKNRKNGLPLLYNSAMVIGGNGYTVNGLKFDTYDKRILADSDHHEDKKYFANGQETKVFKIKGPKGKYTIGVPICEDMWYIDHERNIPGEMVEKLGAEIIINLNQSYFYYKKQQKRFDLISGFAKKYRVPVVYCNAVGLGDIVKNIVIFDGGSMIVDKNGYLQNDPMVFIETSQYVSRWYPSRKLYKFISKYFEISEALIFEQKEFFRLNGIKKAQVHLSGGLDSAIVAALVQEAMGPENCVFITNPTNLNGKSIKYVDMLVKALGNKVITDPLQDVFDKFMEKNTSAYGTELSLTAQASVQATLRTVQGIAASHRYGSGIVATGNHTEIVLGWASFHDIGSIGVHALIGDLTKIELYELAHYINKEIYHKEVIPYDIYNGVFKPAAELPDALGEDPIDYEIYSGICSLLIRERKTVYEIGNYWALAANIIAGDVYSDSLNKFYEHFRNPKALLRYSLKEFEAHVIRATQLMKKSVYKAAQGAPIVIISPRSRGFSNRETLINKYVTK